MKRSFFLFVNVGLGLLLASLLVACPMSPKATLVANQRGPDIDFAIQTSGLSGLLDLRLWQADSKEVVWQINLNYFNNPRLAYGEVPTNFETSNGGRGDAKQVIPSDAKRPRPLAAGKSYILALVGQYDTFITASGKTFYFSFSTDSAGQISAVVPIAAPRPEDIPK